MSTDPREDVDFWDITLLILSTVAWLVIVAAFGTALGAVLALGVFMS